MEFVPGCMKQKSVNPLYLLASLVINQGLISTKVQQDGASEHIYLGRFLFIHAFLVYLFLAHVWFVQCNSLMSLLYCVLKIETLSLSRVYSILLNVLCSARLVCVYLEIPCLNFNRACCWQWHFGVTVILFQGLTPSSHAFLVLMVLIRDLTLF